MSATKTTTTMKSPTTAAVASGPSGVSEGDRCDADQTQ
jgi:hypothetical protein